MLISVEIDPPSIYWWMAEVLMKTIKKTLSVARKIREFQIIRGGKDDDAYGLGDPCVPPQLSHFPEEKPKSSAPLSQVQNKSI